VRECAPAIPFVFAVGITGHRAGSLPAESVDALRLRIADVLERLKALALRVRTANSRFFAPQPPRFLFVSPLADGADQMGAELALQAGFELHAVLPFSRERTREEMPDDQSRAWFDDLLAQATCVLELPGHHSHELEAYVMAGRATVAHCDMLIAVWDGLPPRGRGGTGEIVELALTRGTPLIHLPVDPSATTTIRWSAFDPSVVTRNADSATERAFSAEQLGKLLTALLAPPPFDQERRFLTQFMSERLRKWRTRVEYPLLLAATGVSRFGHKDWREAVCSAHNEDEWRAFRNACTRTHGVDASLGLLEASYAWSDRLAGHFAQSYRSGHVFNFIFAAAAVLIALSALIIPQYKPYLATAEFAVIMAIILNTHFGRRQQWHRRWLDYRQLAERLRPMRSLKLLGMAAPDPPGSATTPVANRWTDWYAAAIWRAVGCPVGRIERSNVDCLGESISAHELRPQVAYHRSSAAQIRRLDHRLERVGLLVFALSVLCCITLILALRIDKHWVEENFRWFTIASAGLPAIGTAIFGIRFQGDFGGSALRSLATAQTLEQIAGEMEDANDNLMRSADLMEEAARAMLHDLDEWRLVNQQHDLTIG
jgi:hypothetical protein